MARQACAEPRQAGPVEAAQALRQIDSRWLFGESRVVTIRHGEDLYTLRITRADKLILTK